VNATHQPFPPDHGAPTSHGGSSQGGGRSNSADNADWAGLRAALTGELLLPGRPGYDAARRPAIANFADVRPLAVVRCATPDDVAAAIGFTAGQGLPAAARAGGHCFAGRSSTAGVVIDLTPMNGIEVEGGRLRVGGGARLGQVYDQLAAHGLTIPAGCGPTVGVAGLTLGGGLGILGRMHGLTSDRLLGADVVLPDGRRLTCNSTEHPDLFWLLRGGGSPGVVTELQLAAVPAPAMTGFHLQWTGSAAAPLVLAWQEWAPDAPDELAASLLVSVAGDVQRPAVVSLFGAFTGTQADAVATLGGLLALVGLTPESAAYRHGSHREVKRFLNGIDVHGSGVIDPPGFMYCKSEYFDQSLPTDTVAALMDALTGDRSPGEVRELDFTPWAGAYTRVPVDASAFVHRTARFLLKHGLTVPAADQDVGRRWLRRSWDLTHPWGNGGCYQNFPDPDLPNPTDSYYTTNAARVRRIRQRYDPQRRFHPETEHSHRLISLSRKNR
jgi:FAD/FMN-containing dehydrogenase